jgi:hypothetical protein
VSGRDRGDGTFTEGEGTTEAMPIAIALLMAVFTRHE